MRILAAAALFVLWAPAAALAQSPADAAAKPTKAKKICKVVGQDTASRMRKRVCRTAQQWEETPEGKTAEDLKSIIAH